jgi:hypothetical protein
MNKKELLNIIKERQSRLETLKKLSNNIKEKKSEVFELLKKSNEDDYYIFKEISSILGDITEIEKELEEIRIDLLKELKKIFNK